MATEYEFWGHKFTEPDFEDEWSEIPYDIDYDMHVAFIVEFRNGDWYDDSSADGWEYKDTWEGDYNETIGNPVSMYEDIRDAVGDEIYKSTIPADGKYRIEADAEFTVYVDRVYIGIAEHNRDDIDTEDVETELSDIKIKNLKIEEIN